MPFLKSILDILAGNSLLLLFVVTAVGYPLGKIRIKGVSLGVSAVLFTAIGFGALDKRLRLPEIVYILGLTLFVYSIGLSSGHSFLASLRRHGLRDNFFAFTILASSVLVALIVAHTFGISTNIAAGMFCGSLTNTPALAGVLETIKAHSLPDIANKLLTEPVVGYSVVYPFGVIGVIISIALARRIWRIDYATEAINLKKIGGVSELFYTRSVLVEKPEIEEIPLSKVFKENNLNIVAGRLKRGQFYSLAVSDALLKIGDIITLTGNLEDLDCATHLLGSLSDSHLEFDSSQFDHRRIFVSNRQIQGRTVQELDIE